MEHVFTTENFDAEVLGSDLPVLVDFYADWCGPCKMMAPIIESMAQQYDGKMKVGKLNVDDNMMLAQKYRVASIPNLILFKNGEAVGNYIGYMSEKELKAKVDADLA